MSLLLYRLSHLCTRHRRIVVLIWGALLVALGFIVASVGAKTSDNLTLPGTGSTEATDLLDRYLPEEANGTNPIVLEVTTGKLTDSANKQVIDRVADTIAVARPHPVERVDDVGGELPPPVGDDLVAGVDRGAGRVGRAA